MTSHTSRAAASYAAWAAAYLAVYALVGWTLSGAPAARAGVGAVVLAAPAVALVLVVLRRRSRWFGCQRLFWDGVAAGAVLWLVGFLGRVADVQFDGRVTWHGWHTVFTLSGNVAPVIALLARPHRGVRAAVSGTVAIMMASYGLLAAFIYVYFVLIPNMQATAADSRGALAAFAQGTRLLLVAGAAAAALVSTGAWRRVYVLLAVGGAAGLLLRALTADASDSVTAAGTPAGTAWLVPFLAFLWAAAEAPPSPTERELVDEPACPAMLCVVPAILMPLIGYTVPLAQSLGDAGDAQRALLTGVMTVGGLGLLTLRLSAQGGELQRADHRVRLLAAAIEQTGDAIVITRADGSFEHANDAFLRSVGYSREELARLGSADLADAAFALIGPDILREVRRDGVWRGTLVRKRRDGSAYHASCTVVALKDAGGRITHLVGVERDITEDLKLRDQLVHAERLSAMGALVAGIAHEINNPLQSILGTAELMLEEQPPEAPRREVELVRREAARAAQIVRNLLAFVRPPTRDRGRADLNEIVRAALALREYHLERSNITLDLQLHPEPLPVTANREEIQQIVLNLVLNAEHALKSLDRRGTIAVRTFPEGARQVLEVADNGPGVSRELRGRIFEPFFTTKDVGQGTGLGLSISHGIAFAHGGALTLGDGGGEGATFRLELPADAAPQRTAEPRERTPASRVALIVDDEAMIRQLLRRMLERRGFEVIEADSGEAAIEMVRGTDPGLIVCDVRMPGMSGTELHSQLTAAKPHLRGRFVFISGDTGQVEVARLGPDVRVLPKPFSSADLDAALATSELRPQN